MKAKITQEVIHTLNKNEIFVFGSNEATTDEQRSIEDIPNYDAKILFEIFGIDRRKK